MQALIFNMFGSTEYVTGSLIDAFDYFLILKRVNKDIKFITYSKILTKNKIIEHYKKLIKDRYESIDDQNLIIDNLIVSKNRNELLTTKFDKVLLLDYGTMKDIKNILQANKIIIISEAYTDNKEYFIDPQLKNVIYYGEMDFEYRDINYRMKIPFNLYKKLNTVDDKIFINSPKNPYLENLKDVLNIDWKKAFFKLPKHKENLFESFNHFIYYHNNTYFDPHPRLFLECKWYNKTMEYHNPHKIKDGSWYRWNDLQENGLLDRELTEDDEVIQEFK